MRQNVEAVRQVLKQNISVLPEHMASFFKTGKGEYAEHDQFMGVPVRILRKITTTFKALPLTDLAVLMTSPINEERLLSLFILVIQYQQSIGKDKRARYQFYLDHLNYVNNWNLVDASAHHVIGAQLFDQERKSLLSLAHATNMWHRRIAIVATWYFIQRQDLDWTFRLAKILLRDPHDLIHKAVGWMLREAGKRHLAPLTHFLNEEAVHMPRTMLRYAIEKFPEPLRQHYLGQKQCRTTILIN